MKRPVDRKIRVGRGTKPLPPFGKQFLAALPNSGLWVTLGPTAWTFARNRAFPVLVLPPEKEASEFRWIGHNGGALVVEVGAIDDNRLNALATELLAAGCPFVVAIRAALLDGYDPRVFFYPEVQYVSN